MSTTISADVASEPPLLEVDDLVQRYSLPRENLFRAGGQVAGAERRQPQLAAGKSLDVVGEYPAPANPPLRAR